MRPVNIVIISTALIGLLVAMAAFMGISNERIMKDVQKAKNSKGFAVVELFTSEGCSSCPPADALMERIQQDNENKDIYILAFHVDYWDHQGWRDRFSDRRYSERQQQYAGWLGLSTIYTPQVVINGEGEFVGSNAGAIVKAIANGLDAASKDSVSLRAKLGQGKIYIEHDVSGQHKDAALVLALVQKEAHSDVKAGENTGRKLSHVQIVRQLAYVDANSSKEVEMKLPEGFNENGWELIGFVQQNGDGRITAATRTGFQASTDAVK
ncbi:DUF1223 domain-containing protein [Chitinophaga filiformis]|uniref:DUF1223 domain-containing protein n=1 Tax=Chitinophaga filiformis TaxID=104663 RepID=UPI001F42260C|nr:DUF1223 domain-containing protein [Chitinophaga filiformis]MCF6407434.1 DUF1223 domain-containing protein [Chitinophaga filiformis]MCF6407660.1 DUF1223 domain-containing protein [Chitinophaga filiformis]